MDLPFIYKYQPLLLDDFEYEDELLSTHKRNIAKEAKNKLMELYYKTNKAPITYAYIYEHIELDDDLKPYLNLQTPTK